MRGVSFITNETSKKRYAQLDLKVISKFDNADFEDLMDILFAEAQKDQKSIPWESVKEEILNS